MTAGSPVSTEAAELAARLGDHVLTLHVFVSTIGECSCGEWRKSGLRDDVIVDAHRAHVAAVLLAEGWHRGGEVEALDRADAMFDALDAEHDKARHVHAAECCWPFPGVSGVLLKAATPPAQDGAR